MAEQGRGRVRRPWTDHATMTGLLALLWVGLWGDLSWANVLAGLVIGAFGSLLWEQTVLTTRYWISPFGCLRYAVHFAWALVVATWTVAVIVLRPRLGVEPAVVAAPVGHTDEYVLAIVANSVTLTPGTITLAVDRASGTIYIHCLTLGPDDEAAVLADVTRFRELAVAAINPRPLHPATPLAGTAGPDGDLT